MATTRIVFLVPGFFGFTSVGAVSYFHDVERTLDRALRRRGVEARIVRCRTRPTASIPRRDRTGRQGTPCVTRSASHPQPTEFTQP